MKCYLVIKKNEVMPFAATWLDLETIIQSDKSERERQIPYAITYMLNLKYDTNQHICKTKTDSYKEYVCGWQRGRAVGEGRNENLGLAEANNYI